MSPGFSPAARTTDRKCAASEAELLPGWAKWYAPRSSPRLPRVFHQWEKSGSLLLRPSVAFRIVKSPAGMAFW